MPRWTAITVDTLNEAKIAALIEACSTAALGDGQPDRVDGLIAGIVKEIRDSVGKRNRLDSDTTKIPGGLRDLAVDLIIARLKNAIEQPLTQDERDNVDQRRRQLRDIEKGDGPAIDDPDDPVEAPVQVNANPGSWGSAPKIKMRTDPPAES